MRHSAARSRHVLLEVVQRWALRSCHMVVEMTRRRALWPHVVLLEVVLRWGLWSCHTVAEMRHLAVRFHHVLREVVRHWAMRSRLSVLVLMRRWAPGMTRHAGCAKSRQLLRQRLCIRAHRQWRRSVRCQGRRRLLSRR